MNPKKCVAAMIAGIACVGTAIAGIILYQKNDTKLKSNGGNFVMAKSKIVKANERIAEKVVGGYQKIEDTVVGSYKKMENAVVGGYQKIEDAFVDRYLAHEGETIEDAKARLKADKKGN